MKAFCDDATAEATTHVLARAARATALATDRAVRTPSQAALLGLRRAVLHHCAQTGANAADLALALATVAALLAAMRRIPKAAFVDRCALLYDLGAEAHRAALLAKKIRG